MKPMLLALALLPGCFRSPVDEPALADAGSDGSDGSDSEVDGAPGTSDAHVWDCDPFVEAACYVGNDPLSGPDFAAQGSGAQCSACEQSSDCQPGLFCTGYIGSAGTCAPLCDNLHPCSEGSCLGVQYQGFGFCPGSC